MKLILIPGYASLHPGYIYYKMQKDEVVLRIISSNNDIIVCNQEIQKRNKKLLAEKIKKNEKSLIKAAASGMLLMWHPLENTVALPAEIGELVGEHLKSSDADQIIGVCKKANEFVKRIKDGIELTDEEKVPYHSFPLIYV